MAYFDAPSKAILGLLLITQCSAKYLPTRQLNTSAESGLQSGFQCEYPSMTGYELCNGPDSRDCWLKGGSQQWDINTDFEAYWPQGIQREYWLDVSEMTISPDGYTKPTGKVVNESYPGPLIEACWGDNITIHVTNYIKENGTTLHWHGLRQLYTNTADGTNGVTQCPIATGDTFTYNFQAVQYGHSWYHSHYALQYPDGVIGPMLIHGPTSADWDEEWAPILINDWLHDSAFGRGFYTELFGNAEPTMDSIVLNGTGNFTCDSSDPRCVPDSERAPIFNKVLETGKRYLLRLVNSATEAEFVFSIDNHELEVISNDYVPITPYKTESLHIAAGQRYAVVVEANPSSPLEANGNYWIRTIVSDNCGTIADYKPTAGIIRYNANSTAVPTSSNFSSIDTTCRDEPLASLVPIVPWQVDQQAANNVTNDTFIAGVDTIQQHGAYRWDLTDTPMWLDNGNPTILNLDNTTWNPEYAIVSEDYSRGYVYLVITSQPKNNSKLEFPSAHPIHLHGHDFVILAVGSSTYDENATPKTFNYNNPPRRDVVLLPAGGYIVIAFRPDNPGIWLLHCHVAWHASSGMALQILERQGEIVSTNPSLDPTKESCSDWNNWVEANQQGFQQEESGV